MDGRKSLSPPLGSKRKKTRKRFSSSGPRKKTGLAWSEILMIAKKAGFAGFVLFFLSGCWYVWSSGYILRKLDQLNHFSHTVVASLGFRVDDVIVEGRTLTLQKEILDILNIRRGDSIFSCSLLNTRQALEALPWVRSASVQRRLPDTLYIRLSERHPVALWQNKGIMYLVDDQGKILENVPAGSFSDLVVLTGEGAPEQARVLIETLADFPDIAQKVTGAIFVGKRRWDIMINHKLRIKLAEFDMKGSLESFSKLVQDHKLENKEILGIDLRFRDRVYFQLSPEALVRKKTSPGKNT